MGNPMIRARVKPDHIAKLDRFSQVTGLNHSQLLRLFVERAELQGSPTISVTIPPNSNTDATSQQAERIGVE